MSLNQKIKILPRHKVVDDRGWFLKIINGLERDLPDNMGEIYSILGQPGETRAGHYHPKTSEWFSVLQGRVQLELEDIVTKDQMIIDLLADNPQTIYVPNGVAHTFKNIYSAPFILVAYADQLYDPTDTVPYQILSREYSK